MKSSMRPIDGQKLKEQLKKRGLTAQACSLALGCDRNYISACVNRGAMNKIVIVGLNREYNIDYADYEPTPEPKPEESKSINDTIMATLESANNIIDYNHLYKVVYQAVYKATKKALTE